MNTAKPTFTGESAMPNVEPVLLRGERVQLEPLDLEHREELFAATQAEAIWEFLPRPLLARADFDEVFNDALIARDRETELPFAIRDLASGKLVGSTRYLEISLANRAVEIGWTWLHPSAWRTRVNSECKYLLLRHAFETLGCVRVQLKTDLRNLRSQNAIARIGGVREGVLRKHKILHNGYVRDTVFFSIIAAEWPAAKERSEQMLEAK